MRPYWPIIATTCAAAGAVLGTWLAGNLDGQSVLAGVLLLMATQSIGEERRRRLWAAQDGKALEQLYLTGGPSPSLPVAEQPLVEQPLVELRDRTDHELALALEQRATFDLEAAPRLILGTLVVRQADELASEIRRRSVLDLEVARRLGATRPSAVDEAGVPTACHLTEIQGPCKGYGSSRAPDVATEGS